MRRFLPLFLVLAACQSEDVDTVAPEFQEISINGSTEEEVDVDAGERLEMSVEASDDINLRQLKIDIHDGFDGHGHGKRSSTAWVYVNILEMSGTSDWVVDSPMVPANATAGLYHAVFRLLDDSGNESAFVERDLIVSNGSEPEISITNPADGASMSPGDTLWIAGDITDAEGLAEVHIILENHDESTVVEVDEWEEEWTANNPTSWKPQDHGVYVVLPTSYANDEVELLIISKDVDGNQAWFERDITVL